MSGSSVYLWICLVRRWKSVAGCRTGEWFTRQQATDFRRSRPACKVAFNNANAITESMMLLKLSCRWPCMTF